MKVDDLCPPKDGQVDTLWRADIDGANARLCCRRRTPSVPAGPEVLSERLHRGVLRRRAHGRARSGGGKVAHLNVPSDLFLVPCDGSSVKSVGQTGDDVVPAWSPDGTKIAYVGQGGFFVLDVKSGVARTVAQGQDFFFGDLLWLK